MSDSTHPRDGHLHGAARQVLQSLAETPACVSVAAVAAAHARVGIEAFRQVPFEGLPADVIEQLRGDGMRGGQRSLEEARLFFEQDVPAEARGSIDGIRAVTNNPDIEAMHIEPYAWGGSGEAANIVYGPAQLNRSIGARTMSEAEIAEAEAATRLVAEEATPGVSGDLGEVVGDTLETGAFGGVVGGGLAAVHRLAQAQGYRDAGRHDLAEACEQKIGEDIAAGAVNGVVRGTAVAATQAILGANPLTAGIGMVAPDAIALLTQKGSLSEQEFNRKAAGVVGKGALATALVCAGPIGWLGLAGLSIATAYGKASQQGEASRQLGQA